MRACLELELTVFNLDVVETRQAKYVVWTPLMTSIQVREKTSEAVGY